MNPHQRNKVDISSMSPDEQRLFRLYGKLPNKKDLLQNKLKERKYFDSGDYALSKAGKASDTGVTSIGVEHPLPENIPHLSATSPPNGSTAGSPGEGVPVLPGAGPHRMSVNGIPGANLPGGASRSPVKENSSFLSRGLSVDESEKMDEDDKKPEDNKDLSVSPPQQRQGVPIRRP